MKNRRVVLAILLGGLVPAFALVHWVVGEYKAERLGLATEWSERGTRDLPSRPDRAAVAFQTALSYGPDRSADRLRLSQALTAAGRAAEARAELLTLWTETPGDGDVNLGLARLAAMNGDVAGAVRYYHAAIDGAWDTAATSARRGARLELARLLLAHGERIAAQSELIPLVDDLPSDAVLMTEVGGLLSDAGADTRALTVLRGALALDPGNAAAATLAGRIAFRSADYDSARTFLLSAAARGPLDPDVRTMLDVATQVLALDPFTRRLGSRDRVQRVLKARTIAAARLSQCEMRMSPDGQVPARLSDLRARMQTAEGLRAAALARDPDSVDELLSLIFDIEALTSDQCGNPSSDDRALQLIAARRQSPSR